MNSPRTSAPSFCCIGVDVGGTKIAAGLVTFPSGQVLARQQIPTISARGGQAVLADVARLCELLSAFGQTNNLDVGGVGIGLCELVDPDGNVLSESCIGWKGVPVRDRFSNLGPVVLEADVRAAALAEACFGAGKNFQQFLYVTVGTGISCCLVLDGKPFTGWRGTMASSSLNVTCENCETVNRQTLEQIASGPALVTRYNRRRPSAAQTGQTVLAAAADGDPDAVAVVRSAGEALGTNVGLLVNVLDPQGVVVGGGLGLSVGLFWESVEASTRQHVWSEVHRDLPILRAATGPDAGVIGAAAAVWKRCSPLSGLPNLQASDKTKTPNLCTNPLIA